MKFQIHRKWSLQSIWNNRI